MQPLIEAGARGANSLKEAVQDANIVITCLLDDNAVLQTTENFIDYLQPNAIHLGTSTILPATSKTLTDFHQQKGSIYVAANVLGIPKAAAQGALTSFVAIRRLSNNVSLFYSRTHQRYYKWEQYPIKLMLRKSA
jgi:3-hydroxyisobutyrate dehydrogenase-like beta-hydroxyacid dehydrogenase